jgi:hypothetical protein
VLLVGYGASAAAVAGIESGAVFSDVAQAPSAEGTLAAFPDNGVVPKANVSAFTQEWQG